MIVYISGHASTKSAFYEVRIRTRHAGARDRVRASFEQERGGMAISIGLPREEYEHSAAVSARLARAFGISVDDDDADEHVQELWDKMFDDMLPSEAASAIGLVVV